jgi:hypothetical protein
MKTSNKILSGLFIFPFLVVLFINLALYAKIKKGDFITQKQEEMETNISQKTSPFSDIVLDGFKNGRVVVKYNDSFSIRYEKWAKDNIEYEVQRNRLVIKTKKPNDYSTITIFCPSFNNLSFDAVEVYVDSMRLGNVSIDAGTDARFNFAANAKNLTINGTKGSEISFESEAVVDTLNLQLTNGATFNKTEGIIKQAGFIQLADSASLNIDGTTMRALLAKPVPETKPQ